MGTWERGSRSGALNPGKILETIATGAEKTAQLCSQGSTGLDAQSWKSAVSHPRRILARAIVAISPRRLEQVSRAITGRFDRDLTQPHRSGCPPGANPLQPTPKSQEPGEPGHPGSSLPGLAGHGSRGTETNFVGTIRHPMYVRTPREPSGPRAWLACLRRRLPLADNVRRLAGIGREGVGGRYSTSITPTPHPSILLKSRAAATYN